MQPTPSAHPRPVGLLTSGGPEGDYKVHLGRASEVAAPVRNVLIARLPDVVDI